MDKKNIITISGSEKLFLSDKGRGVKILTGRVYVYFAPVKNGEKGRSRYLCTAATGDVVPSLIYSAPKTLLGNDEAEWKLYAVSVESQASCESVVCTRADEEEFCRKANVNFPDYMEFGEALLEFYNLEIIRDMRNIYVSEVANTSSKKRTENSIRNLFRKRTNSDLFDVQTDNMLYKAAGVLCKYLNLEYAPLSKIMIAYGRKFDLFDFARVSGFACRRIVLSEGWDKMDIGPVIGYFGEKKVPVTCIPKGKGFQIYFSDTGEVRKLDRHTAEQMEAFAFMFYRRFPQEKMNMKKLIKFALPEARPGDMAGIFFLGLASILVGLLIPYFNEQIYDLYIPVGNSFDLAFLGLVIMACNLGNVSFVIVQSFCNFRVTSRMKYSVEAAAIDRLFNLPQSFIAKFESADISERALYLPEIFGLAIQSILKCGVALIFSLMYLPRMFRFNENLSWLSLVMLTAFLLIVFALGIKQAKYTEERDNFARKNSSVLYQLFSGITKIRMAGAEERGIEQYMDGFIKESKVNLKAEKVTYAVSVMSMAVTTIFSMLFFYLVENSGGDISTGQFIGFTTAFGGLSCAVLECAAQWMLISSIIPLYRNAKPILETVPEEKEDVAVPPNLMGGIKVNNLKFTYDNGSAPVIDGVSFEIKPGEQIGIVGKSGCGKSTLMKLLLGFEEPQKGKIYYDDHDMDSLDKRELRKKMGVVLQNGGIIAGSIYENITVSCPHADRNQVMEAVELAGLSKDIESLPMGLNTVLSEGSGGVSGGQKQRILIARAIVGKPRVLMFDEATSALDNNTQLSVCEGLSGLSATRIVIAHRLSTVMNCDRIFVMDKGRIVEEGKYEDLMAQGGIFYELVKTQIK